MSLRRKAVSIIVGTFLLFIVSIYLVAELVLIERFEKLENREAVANLDRARNSFQEQFNFLIAKAADWIAWDDAYQYVQDGNENFRSANLFDGNGANMQVNYLMYFNADDGLVGSFAWDLENESPAKISADVLSTFSSASYFLSHRNESDIKQSFVVFSKGPAFVVSGPVVTGEKKGPIMGTLVLVKYLTASEIERLSAVTKLKLSVKTWEEIQNNPQESWVQAHQLDAQRPSEIVVQNEDSLAGFTLFFDWQKKPILLAKIEFSRDIMRQGQSTVQIIMLIIVAFGFCFGGTLVLLLQRNVLRRIFQLSKETDRVGNSSESEFRVTKQGSDEIGALANSINIMLESIEEKSNSLRAISENIAIGLLRCDAQAVILDGYSKSCVQLLQCADDVVKNERSLKGVKIWTALNLSKRDAESFQVFYEQIFENSLIGAELIENLPKKIMLKGRTLEVNVSPIFNIHMQIETLLFSFTDISNLEAIEKENANNQALLKILRNLERFKDLVKRVRSPMATNFGNQDNLESELNQWKRSLHTWKGEFAAFGLKDVVSRIHFIESKAETVDQIKEFLPALFDDLNEFMLSNKSVLNLLPKDLDASLVVVEQARLNQLRIDIESSQAKEHEGIVFNFIRDLDHEEAIKVFHYLKDGAQELALRLGKQVFVQLYGEDVKLPTAYREIYSVFVHIVRNAIDHGIETPAERGAKNPIGSLRMEAKELAHFYEIKISDDGRGIDLKAVGRLAINRGLITEREWARLSEDERMSFIFKSGFSTKKDVTYVSGRGIGLDAVQSALNKWGAQIKIESTAGWGTCFTILLPRKTVALKVA